MNRVTLAATALKELESLPKNYQRLILDKLAALAEDARPRGSKKLQGQMYRVRQGPCRILYEVHDNAEEIVVLKIKPRREAYR